MRLAQFVLVTLLSAPILAAQEQPDPVPVLPHRDLQLALARVIQSDLASSLLVGESRAGRQIEALRLTAGKLTPGRPAILVIAGLDGPEAWTSGLVLALARKLVASYGEDDAVRQLLDSTTLYLIPRGNPDACEQRFGSPLIEQRASGPGGDEDRDFRRGEDAPQDVDGDGVIGWMRVPDPNGGWIADEVDPRVLVDAEGTTPGRWRLVAEGLDADGDGGVAEDAPLDTEVNRNFAAGFEEHTPRAGSFPTSEPETRALCDFVLSHRDIQLVLVYGERDGLAVPPEGIPDDSPDVLRVPASGLRASDAALIRDLATRYVSLTGDETGEAGDNAGSFARFCAEHRGLWTLPIDPWSIPLEDKKEGEEEGDGPQPSEGARHLAWLESRGVEAHSGWRPYDHPTLGPVEIGGFRPYALTEPPREARTGLVDGQLAFLASLSGDLARLTLREATWEDLGGGTLDVRATLVNEGRLPLLSTWGLRTRSTRPARIELALPAGSALLAGERLHLVSELAGGGELELRWIVKAGEGSIQVLAGSDHANRVRTTCEKVTR